MTVGVLRSGITTGACSAAAAQAAVLALLGSEVECVRLINLQGREILVPIEEVETDSVCGRATVIKDAGDDPDITHGARIVAEVRLTEKEGIIIAAGDGIGIVTKPGLQIEVGEAAINPVPRQMIENAVRTVLPAGKGAVVTISIPGGQQLAQRTLNPMLGIVGGLSVIGTTGIVEPMSEEAFKASLKPQISVVKAQGYDRIVFVPGKIGQNIAISRYGLPADAVVQTSNFIGYMLESAVEYELKEVLLLGHLGKLVKVAAGIFQTHNRMADARMETLAAQAALLGASTEAVREIFACVTTEAVVPVIAKYNLEAVYTALAARASERAERYLFGRLTVGTAIVSMNGEMLGMDDNARRVGAHLGWNIA